MGYCRRCGEIVGRSGGKCLSCGGANSEPSVTKALESISRSPASDKWSNRYTRGTSRSPSPACSAPGSPKPSETERNVISSPLRRTLAARENLPARESPPVTTPVSPSHATSKPSSEHIQLPLSPGAEPEITRLFGSVLDPDQDKQRWKCYECQQLFVKDDTIYPHPEPHSSPGDEKFYCKPCYEVLFSKGYCHSCHKPVLGQVTRPGELPTVKHSDKLWHKDCCVCTYCAKSVASSPTVGLFGELVCECCFDNAAWIGRPPVSPKVSTPKTMPSTGAKHTPNVSPPKSGDKRRSQISPSVQQLRKTFQDLGLETVKPDQNSGAKVDKKNSSPEESQSQNDQKFTNHDQPGTDDPKSPGFPLTSNLTNQCFACLKPLQAVGERERIIRIPVTGETFHLRCFVCEKCNQPIDGKLEYVEAPGAVGRYHSTCLPAIEKPARTHTQSIAFSWSNNSTPVNSPVKFSGSPSIVSHRKAPRTSATFSPSKFASPQSDMSNSLPSSPCESNKRSDAHNKTPSTRPLSSASAILSQRSPNQSLPNYGGQIVCPVCEKRATHLETALGPSGSRIHPKCLVCNTCHVPLDGNAKLDENRKLICRSCLNDSRLKRWT